MLYVLVGMLYLVILFIALALLVVLSPVWYFIYLVTGWSFFNLFSSLCLLVQDYDK